VTSWPILDQLLTTSLRLSQTAHEILELFSLAKVKEKKLLNNILLMKQSAPKEEAPETLVSKIKKIEGCQGMIDELSKKSASQALRFDWKKQLKKLLNFYLINNRRKSIFKNKILLISGGTGSFGGAVLKSFLTTDIKEIRIFSRDELKQDDMRKFYNNNKLKFYIGDVRDKNSIDDAMRGVDYVFHAAALKQVPSCEFYPMQAVKTNIIGTENLLNSAIAAGVKKVIALSTDKAVYPINAMGISKAMMERVIVAKGKNVKGTMIACTRYGNVMASRGSVIPLFIDQIKNDKPITITDPNMTRFMMSLDDAVDLVLFAFENGKSGDIFVQKAPAATVELLAHTMRKILGAPDHEIKTIGTRHGEKLYETLLTKEEMVKAIDMEKYYRIPADTRDLNYSKFFEEGEEVVTEAGEYHSHNTHRLNEKELTKLLLDLNVIQDSLKRFQKNG
jgi:UDP-N-acetylglucosamine 4,6-dehydratase/5-epimerase